MKNKNLKTNDFYQEIMDDNLPPKDGSQFKPITIDDLTEVLGLTIKRDETNKLITFLAQLSAFTKDSQVNISFNAPSSTGKSFIPIEISKFFPAEDVVKVGYCSPTAFFHDHGVLDDEKKGYTVDLSGKILIFLDQPHTLLLQHLRPLLSHDEKEINIKITDKNQRSGLRTKNIRLIGYPSVTFCTVGLKLDEQEGTRFLLLSPQIDQEKIREAVHEKIKKEADSSAYDSFLESDPERIKLKERVSTIKEEGIGEIKIGNPKLLETMFFKKTKNLKPRHQRDIGRIISIVKVLALLNLWFREREGNTLIANEDDIREAYKIWDEISVSQELNLPPYVFNLYKEIILEANREKNSENVGGVKFGLTRQDILQKHYKIYQRHLPEWQLRQQIIPPLEASGLITQEPDPNDKRRTLVYPTTPLTISQARKYSESGGGVEETITAAERIFGVKAELVEK
ncbi:hypothetical protein ACFL0Y_03760, partial [Patescibacteria group bacterium]